LMPVSLTASISMTEDELAEANRRLAEPPVVDVSVSRRMGLFVVGRLALRHGIRVHLRKNEGAGLVAMVLLPPALIADGTQQPLPQRPAFGGGTVPGRSGPLTSSTPAPAPASNGTFRSFASSDSFDAAAGGQGPFEGGRPRHAGAPSGPGGSDGVPPAPGTPGRTYDSTPGTPRPASFHSDPGRAGIAGFTADTDGGSYRSRPASHDSQGYLSYPSSPSLPSGNGAFQTPPPSYPTNDVRRSEPIPAVEVSALEQEQEEFLPIFAAVESAWFRKPENADAEQPEGVDHSTPAQAVPSGEESWRTAADAGWQAAARASEPSLGGVTAAGLPKRTPKANLVPGTASRPAQQQPQPQPQAPVPPVSADRMRSRMAGFQQGVRRGRQEVRGQEDKSE
ncbi:hypothetical protein ACWEPC_20180, partial [Nonomuraea sp. NPDC004297]